MKRFTLTVTMLALGTMVCSTKANAASLFKTTQVNTESTHLTNNTIAQASGWKKFSSPDGKFSVLVPSGEISKETSNEDSVSQTLYSLINQQSAFIFGYQEFSTDISLIDTQKLFDVYVKEFLGTDNKLVSQQNISMGKYSGREIQYQDKATGSPAKLRLFLVGRKIYILVAFNTQGGDTEKFFNSFEL